MFKCDRCGCCCRNLDKNNIYASLNRGDGTCIYLKGKDCSIYENRPLLCRVDECYDLYFSNVMTKEEYYRVNKKMCEELRKMEE